jgi:hypothetical protein
MILPEELAEDQMVDTEQDSGRFRSPNFPAFDLGEALELAQQLYEKEGRAATREGVVVTHWGYGSLSGRARRKLAALKHFGLLEGEGSGRGKLMRLSQLALKILLDPDKSSPGYLQALREAALRPVLIKHLYDEYRNGLPSDETIKYNLLLDKKFTDRAADQFVPVFRKTLKIAQLLDPLTGAKPEGGQGAAPSRPAANGEPLEMFGEGRDDTSGGRYDDGEGRYTARPDHAAGPPAEAPRGAADSPSGTSRGSADPAAGAKSSKSPTSVGPFLTFVLPGDNFVELKLGRRVSAERFRQILAMIDSMKPVFIEGNGE